jgi:hypothetical protein
MGPFTLDKTRLKSTLAHFLHPHWVNQGQVPLGFFKNVAFGITLNISGRKMAPRLPVLAIDFGQPTQAQIAKAEC